MSPTKAAAGPLAERSPNPTSPTKPKSASPPGKLAVADVPMFKMQTQTQNTGSQTYISPSDAIRSPTTKKLSEIKGRRFMNAKPQTLFAKTLAKENLKAQAQAQGHGQDGVQR
ncbi:uncharacterized protein Z520_06256 [Fonsecaea multimorphosa CBS 102226]|uniref:Spo12-like protein n=1 Tax=Fonsecaea multimorphosa CBS 102226 TaxID=1442371 RepID=A0A0D2IMC2_9EURO|nr:uncharacterized protein Z520_06256 [Fonsecaea multimorphosa CBS 102226]KIX98176.1 hypothetical protein Z520_06256 [Fonsecaea multimorphosa CBS 102226]OAL24251.1 hypothetical protein AYO22_05911 [Fonsecaea multimorphosa]